MTAELLVVEEPKKVLRRTWSRLQRYRRLLVLASVVVVIQAGGTLAGPVIVKFGIDEGVRTGDTGQLDLAVVMFIFAALTTFVAGRAVIVLVGLIGEGFLRDLRRTVFEHQMRMSMDFFDRNRTGTLVSRMTADIEALQELVGQGLSAFIVGVLLFVGSFVVMFLLSWQLSLVALVAVPFVFKASSWFRRESHRAYLLLRDRVGTTLTTLQEGLSGVRVVQAFAQEPITRMRFEEDSERQFEAHLETERVAAWYFPVIELAQGWSIAAVLVLGGWLSTSGAVTVGTVAAFVLYLQNLYEPIQQLSQLLNTLQASAAALEKLYGLLDEQPSITDGEARVELPLSGALVVESVSFAYANGEPVLSNVSIRLEAGRRLALVGPTGAGKSTLAKLMVRFYDPTEGVVSFAGVDLRDTSLASLRKRIVVVPQEGFLFDGTVRDNLLIGDGSADDERLWQAIDELGLRDRFEAFGAELDTVVNERGANFSAGERQLISVVRSALENPAVIVLDEATSSLDPGTELIVERSIDRLTEGRTVV
ncbi:MAG: ABC transporter ATP-binding protein, partial [Acidobacteria bacterium]|nr:ABC transporter ATP-binding protein [Acidobacteriota bacterium]